MAMVPVVIKYEDAWSDPVPSMTPPSTETAPTPVVPVFNFSSPEVPGLLTVLVDVLPFRLMVHVPEYPLAAFTVTSPAPSAHLALLTASVPLFTVVLARVFCRVSASTFDCRFLSNQSSR